jgi:drug/metabolite transporter (DMT)-like permease
MTTDLRLAYAVLFVAPLLFSANMLMARAVGGSIPPVAMAFWRWTLTLVFLVPYAASDLKNSWRGLLRDWRSLLLLGALGMGVCGAPVYLGAATTTATNIGLIFAASPVLIVVFARLFWGEKVSARQAAGIALCLTGVLILIARADPHVLLGLDFVVGDLLIVAAMAAWALYSVLLKYRPSRQKMTVRFIGIVIGGVIVMAPFYALEMATGHWASFDQRTVGVVLFLAIVPGIGAYLAYSWLVAVLGPSRTGLLLYLSPIYNASLAYLLLGEKLHLYHLLGTALILPGLWLATFAEGPPVVARAAAEG